MRLFLGLLFLLVSTIGLYAQGFRGILSPPTPGSSQIMGRAFAQLSETQTAPEKTYMGDPLLLSDASFILSQASLCPNWEDLEELQSDGLEIWIKKQSLLPPTFLSGKVVKWQMLTRELMEEPPEKVSLSYRLAKWQNTLTAKDQLRQRIAETLDEMFQKPGSLESFGFSSLDQGRYFDLLIKHALGNYHDLLRDLAADSALQVILENQGLDMEGESEGSKVHPHTRFHLADALIRTLLSQSPSPGFVQRVAQFFEGNDTAEEGDLARMIYAIYSDPEAKLLLDHEEQLDRALFLEPMLKYSRICEILDALSVEELSAYLNEENKVLEEGEVAFLNSPDLFSFFMPKADVFGSRQTNLESNTSAGLVMNFIQEVQQHGEQDNISYTESIGDDALSDDLDEILALTDYPHELIEYLDLLFVQGLLSDFKKGLIEQTISEIAYPEDRFSVALYLIFISAEYKSIE